MARAIWSGTVGFGLVQIPVGLHVAEESRELSMTLLDRRDLSPVGYERLNKKTGKEVKWENIVKGYEHAEGEYVVLDQHDFEAANVEASKQIDILDFVELSEIDPRYFERPYFMVPLKGGAKSYALLREALQRTGKAGIGKVVLRTRQHLAAVVAQDDALMLLLLRFQTELRSAGKLDLPETGLKRLGISSKEIDMAERLIGGMVGKFEPAKYRDDYRSDLKRLIARKVKAGEVNVVGEPTKPKRKAPPATTVDLAELLAQSVAGGKKSSRAANENHEPARKGKPAKARKRQRESESHRKSA